MSFTSKREVEESTIGVNGCHGIAVVAEVCQSRGIKVGEVGVEGVVAEAQRRQDGEVQRPRCFPSLLELPIDRV